MGVTLKVLFSIAALIAAVFIAVSVMKAVMKVGKYRAGEFKAIKSGYKDWESVFSHPQNITVETLHAGEVTGTVHGIINMKNEKAEGLEDKKLKAPLLSHLIKHEKHGDFLIDTGFDSSFASKHWGNFEGILKKGAFKFSVEKGHGIDELLTAKKVNLKGVFCTHFHEHQGGAPALPHDIPFTYGKGEKEIDFFPIAYARFLKDKSDLREFNFDKAEDMPIIGKAIDVFGDGSFWAISTPGHSKGHVSYLVNGKDGCYLIMGDVCMCRKGFEIGVESGGKYAENLKMNRESFEKVKNFVEAYSQVIPVFGHESEEYPVKYE